MTMRSTIMRAGLAALLALGGASAASAAGGETYVLDHEWSFEGPFGTFDQAQLQRGWQVFSEVCAGCHGLKYVSFRDLGDPMGPAFPAEQVKAIAAAYPIQIRTIDADGEPTERPAIPADKIPSPYANEEQAKAANNGAIPPDLSNITKARVGYHGTLKQLMNGSGGPEYVYSLLLGYQDEPPEGFEVGDLYYNRTMAGHRIAMAQPLYEDSVEYQDGTPATLEQQSADLVAFLAWAGEPKMIERKQAGVMNVILLTIFSVLLWYSNKQLWKPIKKGGVA